MRLSWRFATKTHLNAHAHVHTMTKVITLSDESYVELKKWKGQKSFSQTILQLTRDKPKTLSEIVQSWDDSSELADALEKVYAQRAHRNFRRNH